MKADLTLYKSGEQMSIWKNNKKEIDVKDLKLRLQSLVKECNIEVIHLALESLLEELEEKNNNN